MPKKFSESGLTAAQVRTHCARILASAGFLRSKRQCAFLEYVINASLQGHADRLKEFAIGVEVFGKDESFDPGVDSIVRVEASRLRSKLSEYYVGEGQNDAIRITIPKGHYVPEFSVVDATNVKRKFMASWKHLAGFAVTTAVLASIFLNLWPSDTGTAEFVDTQPIPSPLSIAVLPLRDWSQPTEEYFSDAMTDALISALANTGSLRVTSLTSIMRYKNTDIPIPEIGRVLDVAYILEGSVSRNNENVRITAQLIKTESDQHLWARTFDRSASDLLSVQSDVADAIARQISGEIQPVSPSQVKGLNPAAHEAFLKGRYFYNQFTGQGIRRGIDFFQEAINIEPEYAEAYSALASCHCLLAGHGLELVSPIMAIPEARSMANKALSINPDLAEPIAFLGIISFKYEWDFVKAENLINRALKLNPSLYQAYVWHSQILEAQSRNEEALEQARVAKQLNPLSLAASLNLGWQLYQAEKYIEAKAEIDKLIDFDPGFWGGHWAKGYIYNQHKSYQNAIDAFQQAVTLGGGHSLPLSGLGYSYALAGRHSEARQTIAELEVLSKDGYVSPFHIAIVYAGLNEPDLMFEWLERAFQVRARSLAWLPVTNEMKPYYDDPRFQSMLERIGVSSSS